MKTDKIRKSYLDFFVAKGHRIIPSASLIPKNDPTLLFTGAGMSQFKTEFLGRVKDFARAVSCQKCLRTQDMEKVGETRGHHTFFEMLGNFSFGDYFKEEAITWAWEFLTEVLKLKERDLWVSVYRDDDEAFQIWKRDVGIPESKIVKLGDKENFWPQEAKTKGPNGPCGPCSEIFFDMGEDFGCGKSDCSPACDCGRFVEVWNLVFTQFDRGEDGTLVPLPNKNIDTGMGLERIARVMQKVETNFKVDIFRPIIEEICRAANERYGSDTKKDSLINIVADHSRAVTFTIADGILPSNEGRGYVVRMLIRRAFRSVNSLDIEVPFLYRLVGVVAKTMEVPYPELSKRRENISQVVLAEEEHFQATLKEGTRILKETIRALKAKGEKTLPAETAFRLYDTSGFPFDLTEGISKKEGLAVNREGFEEALNKQRERSRKTSQMKGEVFTKNALSLAGDDIKAEFIGYKEFEVRSKVLAIIDDGKRVDFLKEGGVAQIILDKTPFYGESGGQVGDNGRIFNVKAESEVTDTQIIDGCLIQYVEVKRGVLHVGNEVTASIDEVRRLDIARNHTATHLLQSALRKVLGEHIEQSGSLVNPSHLRFDFTHFKAISDEQLRRIEDIINENIRGNHPVKTEVKEKREAEREGAIALFGEKYEDRVRVVSIGEVSKELCGGTHLESTGQIGLFKIINEEAIASGIRRIEAVTGREALKRFSEYENIVNNLSRTLKSPPEKIPEAIVRLQHTSKDCEKEVEGLKTKLAREKVDEIIQRAEDVSGIKVVSEEIEGADASLLRATLDLIRDKFKNKRSIVVLGSSQGDRVSLVAGLTQDLVKEGFDVRQIIKELAAIVGGSGGGRPDLAQAGGRDTARLTTALKEVALIVKRSLCK